MYTDRQDGTVTLNINPEMITMVDYQECVVDVIDVTASTESDIDFIRDRAQQKRRVSVIYYLQQWHLTIYI